MNSARPLVAVFGSGSGTAEDRRRARALGAGLARAGFDVINGGYGGTMEASARGAREAGGSAVGVTCAAFTSRSGANPHVSEVVEAPTLIERMGELIGRAEAYVVLPGGVGTLAELAVAWEHRRKGLIDGPLVAWEEPWRRVLGPLLEGPHVPGGGEGIVWAGSVEAAIDAVRAGHSSGASRSG